MTRQYTRPTKDESDDEFVERFVAEFRRTGLLKIKAELELPENTGKTLKQIMSETDRLQSYIEDSSPGDDIDAEIAQLEKDARAVK